MLTFNEEKHEYLEDGKKLISTTQLMRKHNLSPSYDGVSTFVLNNKAKRGTFIHKEIENLIKFNEEGFSSEAGLFSDYMKEHKLNNVLSETMVNNDIVAGTIDLIYEEDLQKVIADIKTTYVLHKESVSWQLSIYLFLLLHGKKKNWETWKGKAFHFDNAGVLNVVEIPLKPYEEVEKLIQCERDGILYVPSNIDIAENQIQNIKDLESVIEELNEQVKEAKAKQEDLKMTLMEEMKKRELTSFEKNGVKLTIVSPSKMETNIEIEKMDKDIVENYAKAKELYDEEAEKHTITNKIPLKQYLRITLKKEKKNE